MRYAMMVFVIVLCSLIIGLLPAHLFAKNGDISAWTKNISEIYGNEITAYTDYNAEIAVSGETVHALWMADSAYATRQIYYRRSLDGGQTWEQRKMVFSDAFHDIVSSSVQERMAVDGDTIHVVINGYGRGPSWWGKLTYIRSIDNGQTFEDPRILYSTDEAWHVLDSRIRAEDGQVTILFRAQANWYSGNAGRLLISEDGGENFRDEFVYSRDDGSSWSVVDFYWQDSLMYVLYYDSYYSYGLVYGNLYLAASTDGGSSFDSQMISVPSANDNHKTYSLYDQNYIPKIGVSGNTVYVIWSGEDEAGTPSIFVRRSTDNGGNWDSAFNLTRDHLPEGMEIRAGHESIVSRGDYVYVIFNTTAGKLFFTRSQDGGAHFETIRRISKNDGTKYVDGGWWPRILVDPSDATGRTVHLLWSWFTHDYSSDGGTTFRGPALLSPHFSWNGTGPQLPKWVITTDRQIHIIQHGAWSYYNSTGLGDQDIFYRLYDLDAPEESEENQALQIDYLPPDNGEAGQERYDNMQIRPHADLSFSNALTAEFWFRLDRSEDLNSMRLLVKENSTSWFYYPSGYQMGLNMSDALRPNGGVMTTTGEYMAWSGHVMVPGTWTHLALTYDSTSIGDNLLLYVNGELSASAAGAGGVLGGAGILFIGATGISEATQGSYDELRLWNRALSAQEIKDNMSHPLTGSEIGLVAYYPFDGTTRDMTGNGHDGVLMYRENFVPTDWHTVPVGDINGDGGINVLDMISIANHIMSIINLGDQEQTLADCNGDGTVNVLDMVAIANVILGVFETCPGNGCKPPVTPEVLDLIESMEAYLSPEAYKGIMALVKTYNLPTEFGLSQNYPNPFNPTTDISYQLPGGGVLGTRNQELVTLRVYNVLGQEVATLVDGIQDPGYYTVTWNASDVASGVYYYRLSSGDFVTTRKMVLMK